MLMQEKQEVTSCDKSLPVDWTNSRVVSGCSAPFLLKERAAVKETQLSGPGELKTELQTDRGMIRCSVSCFSARQTFRTRTASLFLGGEQTPPAAARAPRPPAVRAGGRPTSGSAGPEPAHLQRRGSEGSAAGPRTQSPNTSPPAAGRTSTGRLHGPQPTAVHADTCTDALKNRSAPDS